MITLGADFTTRPNYANRLDHDVPALVLTCRSLDPTLRTPTVATPFDFTLPRETLDKYHREHPHLPIPGRPARRREKPEPRRFAPPHPDRD